jgi:hypothetical protein
MKSLNIRMHSHFVFPFLNPDRPRVSQSREISLVLPLVLGVDLADIVVTQQRSRHFEDLHPRKMTAWTRHISCGELSHLAPTQDLTFQQLTTIQFLSSFFVSPDIQRSGFH